MRQNRFSLLAHARQDVARDKLEPNPRKDRSWLSGVILVISSLGVIGLLASACAPTTRTVRMPLAIEGATFVGNKTCADCHTNITRIFPTSAHARIHGENLKMTGLTGCESCHGPGSKHVQGGGGRGKFIINPGKDPTPCFECHLEIQAEFHLPHRHPVLEGKMNCVQCHDPHGSDIRKAAGGLAMARLNQSCTACHREQTRPKVFEHEALREGCTTCHNPHGSVSPKMLVERDANLCLKCHAQAHQGQGPPGELNIGAWPHAVAVRHLPRGTCWSAGCHTAVHGSNMSRQMMY